MFAISSCTLRRLFPRCLVVSGARSKRVDPKGGVSRHVGSQESTKATKLAFRACDRKFWRWWAGVEIKSDKREQQEGEENYSGAAGFFAIRGKFRPGLQEPVLVYQLSGYRLTPVPFQDITASLNFLSTPHPFLSFLRCIATAPCIAHVVDRKL